MASVDQEEMMLGFSVEQLYLSSMELDVMKLSDGLATLGRIGIMGEASVF